MKLNNKKHELKNMKFVSVFFLILGNVVSYQWQSYIRKTPIVFASECEILKTQLADISYGNRFLFMTDMSVDSHMNKEPIEIRDNLRFLLQLSLLLQYSITKPIIQLDTTYSQYLSDENKLRYSSHDEVVQSLNLVRAFLQGGMGDISHYQDWIVVENKLFQKRSYQMEDCLRFMETFSIRQPLTIDNYYIGHELGVLPYEKQMTRNDSVSYKTYACSSHFLWIKDLPDPLTMDYLCTIENPLGIIVDDHTPIVQLIDVIKKLNPHNQAGKLTLLIQMRLLKTHLPPLIDLIQKEKQHVSWCCHPMGSSLCSTYTNLHQFLNIHQKKQTHIGGIFLSMKNYKKEDLLQLVQYFSHFLKTTKTTPHRKNTWNRFSL